MASERDLGALTVLELVGEALATDEDDAERWKPIGEVQRRGDEETLAAALELIDRPDSNGRILGADILRQIAGCFHIQSSRGAARAAR